jgi:hypothetical protein
MSNLDIEVPTTVNLAEVVQGLTEGQKIHLVNHLYKHYDIAPTKLRNHVKFLEALAEADIND